MNTNLYTPYQAYEVEQQTNLRALFMRYARNWPWFVLSLMLALAAAYVYLLYQAPVYNVQASVLVKDERKGISEQSAMKETEIFTQSKLVENEIEILKSYTLMDRVVTNLGLDVRYFRPTSTLKKQIFQESPIRLLVEKPTPQLYLEDLQFSFVDAKTVKLNGKVYPVNQSIQTPLGQLRILARKPLDNKLEPLLASVSSHNSAIEGYLANLKIESTSKLSTVLVLSLQESVPDRGEAILNQLISEYNKEEIVDKNKEANKTLNFLEDRLALISGELSTVEKRLKLINQPRALRT